MTSIPKSKTTPITEVQQQLYPLLKCIVQNKPIHVRWLNTLAFLEHIGSRKIIKSQNSVTLNRTLLQHISEEARHALYFKNLAYRLSPGDCPTFEEQYLLKGEMAENYFQNIDHQAEQELSQSNDFTVLNYLYTTWMIEERAVMVYELYNTILKSKSCPFNLDFILQEENHHLKTVTQIIQKKDTDFKERTKRLFQYERSQFIFLIQEWQSELSSHFTKDTKTIL